MLWIFCQTELQTKQRNKLNPGASEVCHCCNLNSFWHVRFDTLMLLYTSLFIRIKPLEMNLQGVLTYKQTWQTAKRAKTLGNTKDKSKTIISINQSMLNFFFHSFNALNENESVHIKKFTSDCLACLFLLDVQRSSLMQLHVLAAFSHEKTPLVANKKWHLLCDISCKLSTAVFVKILWNVNSHLFCLGT